MRLLKRVLANGQVEIAAARKRLAPMAHRAAGIGGLRLAEHIDGGIMIEADDEGQAEIEQILRVGGFGGDRKGDDWRRQAGGECVADLSGLGIGPGGAEKQAEAPGAAFAAETGFA